MSQYEFGIVLTFTNSRIRRTDSTVNEI